MPIDLPSNYDAFKADAIADQASEAQGVYEVWWNANSWYPDQPLSTRLAIAESVVTDLLREGASPWSVATGSVLTTHARCYKTWTRPCVTGPHGCRSRTNRWCGWLMANAHSLA